MADEEPVRDPRFTAEISNRMRVPDRIMVAGENQICWCHRPLFWNKQQLELFMVSL